MADQTIRRTPCVRVRDGGEWGALVFTWSTAGGESARGGVAEGSVPVLDAA